MRLSDLHWIDGFVARERAIDELVKTFQLAEDELPQATAGNEAFRHQGGMLGETSAEAKRWALDEFQHRDAEPEPQQKVEEERPAARADRWRQKSEGAAKRTLASMSAPVRLVGLPGFRNVTSRLAQWSGRSLTTSACWLALGVLAGAILLYAAATYVFFYVLHLASNDVWVVQNLIGLLLVLALLFILSLLNVGIVASKSQDQQH